MGEVPSVASLEVGPRRPLLVGEVLPWSFTSGVLQGSRESGNNSNWAGGREVGQNGTETGDPGVKRKGCTGRALSRSHVFLVRVDREEVSLHGTSGRFVRSGGGLRPWFTTSDTKKILSHPLRTRGSLRESRSRRGQVCGEGTVRTPLR